MTRRRKRWKKLGGELIEKRNQTDTGITDTTDRGERKEMIADRRDLGGTRDRRKKKDHQRVNQDEKDIEMTRESAIDDTEIHLGKIHRSDKDGGKRNPKTVGHIEEMTTDEMMTGKDVEEGEKTTTTVIGGEIEANLLGVVKISF